MRKRPQFAVMFPHWVCNTARALALFCFVLEILERMCFHRRWAMQKTASRRTVPPTGWTSFMNKLSSLFRTCFGITLAMFTKGTKTESALRCGKERTFRYGLRFKICERRNVTVELMWNKKNRCVSHHRCVHNVNDMGRVVSLLSYSCLYCRVQGCDHKNEIPTVIMPLNHSHE